MMEKEELKEILTPLFNKHMENILSGSFSTTMMRDWENDDNELLNWREETSQTVFEKTSSKLWDKNMDILSKGCFLISRGVYQKMIDQKN